MTLNDAVNEMLRHAPAFREIRIFPMMSKRNDHIVIADNKVIQGIAGISEYIEGPNVVGDYVKVDGEVKQIISIDIEYK